MAESGKMDKNDWIKIAKGAGIAVGGALVVYATDLMTSNPMNWTPVSVALASSLINLIKVWLQDNS
jgi:hypothetical protein